MKNFVEVPTGLRKEVMVNDKVTFLKGSRWIPKSNGQKTVTLATLEKVEDYLKENKGVSHWRIHEETNVNYYALGIALKELIKQGKVRFRKGKFSIIRG